jgi:sugar phosphate isomerase/epimerase
MSGQIVPRRFGFMASLDFASWPVKDVVVCLAQSGYTAVEWTLAHFHPFDDPKSLVDLVKIPEQYGLTVSEAVVQQDLVTLDPSRFEERIDFVEASIWAAAQTGIEVLNLFTGPAPWDAQAPRLGVDIQEGEAWEVLFKAFDRLLPLAEKHHIYLAVEAVFGQLCHDYYTLSELLRHYDSEYLAVNMDPSHFQLYGNDVPWVIGRLGPRIRHIHLKDVAGRPGLPGKEFIFPLLGEGTIDWSAFADAVDGIGYRGALSVEFEAFGYYERVLEKKPERAAALSMEQIKRLFGQSRS